MWLKSSASNANAMGNCVEVNIIDLDALEQLKAQPGRRMTGLRRLAAASTPIFVSVEHIASGRAKD